MDEVEVLTLRSHSHPTPTLILTANVEGAEFMSYTAARHQGAFKMFWLHLKEAAMSSVQAVTE